MVICFVFALPGSTLTGVGSIHVYFFFTLYEHFSYIFKTNLGVYIVCIVAVSHSRCLPSDLLCKERWITGKINIIHMSRQDIDNRLQCSVTRCDLAS